MKRVFFVLCLIPLSLTLGHGETVFPAASIYTRPGYPGLPPYDPTIRASVVIWSDGQIVWSRDQRPGRGGPPYLTARIAPSQVQALLNGLERKGGFDESLPHAHGDHSRSNVIHLQTRKHKTIFTLTREHLINLHTEEDRRFRRLWDDMRSSIEALIPKKGTTYERSAFVPPK